MHCTVWYFKITLLLQINTLFLLLSLRLFSLLPASSDLEYDPERFADQEVPILIVGTKQVSPLSHAKDSLELPGSSCPVCVDGTCMLFLVF